MSLLLFQYDEVIRRDSETSTITPIATTPFQALSGVPEVDEPGSEADAGVIMTSAVDCYQPANDNQDAGTTAEEDLDVEAPA